MLKVALVRGAQFSGGTAERGRESAHARDLIGVAERFAWRARLPLVIVVCGAPASGKSYLARTIAELSGFAHLSSDIARKQLAGFPPTRPAGDLAYTTEWNQRTYAKLGRRAAREVAAGRGAIVDATFRHRSDREAFARTFAAAAPALFLECHVPRTVLALRAARRARDPARVSDADVTIALREQRAWEPLDEVPSGGHIALRTDRPVDQIVGDALALLDRRLLDLAQSQGGV